jgi:TRAP-type mannitol/chloroaromatic compound transport system permease large subunit
MDFIEIAFIILPILGPTVLALNKPGTADFIPGFGIWFTIVLAVTLQTSYLTPPVASSMFYLKGVNPKEVDFPSMYRGILPFVILQLVGLGMILAFKPIVLWLPGKMIGY